MTPNRLKRLYLVLGIVVGVAIAGALALQAFRNNVTFFFDPTQVAAGEVQQGKRFRLGGMVKVGSVRRTPGSLEIRFIVTDLKNEVPVRFDRVLPDLFKENSGVVVHGRIDPEGVFIADEMVAKHDENYMPPEVTRSLKRGESRLGLDEAAPAADQPAASNALPAVEDTAR
jgi:cytochrome c-type biogenesis protein CcmE